MIPVHLGNSVLALLGSFTLAVTAGGVRPGPLEGEEQHVQGTQGRLTPRSTTNFGHGSETLSSLLATFNLIAFLVQSACELECAARQAARAKLAARHRLLDHLKFLARCFVHRDWDEIMETSSPASCRPGRRNRPMRAPFRQSRNLSENQPNKRRAEQ